MAEPYVELREQLRAESPKLYDSLMRSWEIAENEWLPAISGNEGSFNAYPHIRNHERYADEILKQAHEIAPDADVLHMTPAEKYLLLAGMLFHDIGRTQVGKGHAVRSQQLIKSNFSSLGIEQKALADILADICCYHDCTKAKARSLNLREHGVTPYGVIHTKRIAVLLKFIDNLDGAYTRVLPHYLQGSQDNMIEGFRRSTAGIRVDLRNHMIVTTTSIDREALGRLDEKIAYSASGPKLEVEWGDFLQQRKDEDEGNWYTANPEYVFDIPRSLSENSHRGYF